MEDPVVQKLSRKYGKLPAQILVRHLTQRGLCVIPKSTNPARIRVYFDFEPDTKDFEEKQRLDNMVSVYFLWRPLGLRFTIT